MRYDIVAFVLISLISIAAIGYSIYLFSRNRKLVKSVIDLHLDRSALEDMIKNQAVTDPIDQSEGFIKFLSDSREWAFNYIDNVQQVIFVLKEEYDKKKALDESLQKLFDMLPENNKEK